MTMPKDEELLQRVISRQARLTRRQLENKQRKHIPLWSKVAEMFSLGSTYSKHLCLRFNFNPEDGSEVA